MTAVAVLSKETTDNELSIVKTFIYILCHLLH